MSSELHRVAAVLESVPGIRIAYVFGSVAKGTARAGSDLDVAIVWEPDAPADSEALALRALESATDREIDLVDLRTAPPLLGREVLRHGRVLLCRDQAARAEFELHAIAEYLDTEHLRRVQRQYLAERAERYRAAGT